METQHRLMKWLFVILAMVAPTLTCGGLAAAGNAQGKTRADESARLALRYAEALAAGRTDDWARLDLGCLSRLRAQAAGSPDARARIARTCYDDTVTAYRAMIEDTAEPGVLGPTARGRGLGLLSETHRHASLWKDYPPALFLSPAALRSSLKTPLTVELRTVSPTRPIAIGQGTATTSTVGGTLVELAVTYPDPFAAPIALAPNEVWWASGSARRYQPVHSVVIRLVVASNLRRLGYAEDRAVINEVLPDAPRIPATSYGLNPTDASLQPEIRGHFVLGSVQWWTRALAGERYSALLKQAELTADTQEKRALFASLLLLDPTDPHVNAQLGALEFEAFLREGLAKAGIGAPDDPTKRRLAELYWNLQAQTWRQELTDVAVGHSPAAEAFYAAFQALEAAVGTGTASPELQRQLGVLHRWNNDVPAALALHESLLRLTEKDHLSARSRLLADLAWDRIQWVSWDRRYDHPWLQQAQDEARQALELARDPIDRVIATQALFMAEALAFTRTPEGLRMRLSAVKEAHEHLAGVTGLWPYLVGNDVVKALVPDGQRVTLPTPVRAPDVLNVEVHAKPPQQDIVWQWNFEQDPPETMPAGFVALSTPGAEPSGWRVLSDGQLPAPGKLVVQDRPCGTDDCAHLLLADRIRTTYPDATVQLAELSPGSGGEAGIALAVRDNKNFYSVTLNPSTGKLTTRRVTDGRTTVLGDITVKLAPRPWHSLRVQRINFLHLDRGRLSVFVDGAQVAAVADEWITQEGSIGLITVGQTAAQFDGFHLLDLVSNRTLSEPAAY
jgi:hypothetical protein